MKDFISLAADRYSVRNFSSKAVEDEKIDRILEAAKLAPTAVNYQPQKLYVVKSAAALEKINALRPLFGAQLAIIVCYDETRSWKNSRDNAHDSGDVDAAIVTTHMMLAAWEVGIGSCWMGAFSPADISATFGIPLNEHPVAILAMGYPADDCKPSERHTVYRSEEDIVRYL